VGTVRGARTQAHLDRPLRSAGAVGAGISSRPPPAHARRRIHPLHGHGHRLPDRENLQTGGIRCRRRSQPRLAGGNQCRPLRQLLRRMGRRRRRVRIPLLLSLGMGDERDLVQMGTRRGKKPRCLCARLATLPQHRRGRRCIEHHLGLVSERRFRLQPHLKRPVSRRRLRRLDLHGRLQRRRLRLAVVLRSLRTDLQRPPLHRSV
jgi:hypothetical protein